MHSLSLLPTTAHHSPSVGDCPSSPTRIFVLYVFDSPHSMPDAPASPRKTVSSASQQVRSQKKPGAPKPKGAVRAKSGCYTCRIRRKVRPRGAHHPLSKSLTPISSLRVFFPSSPPPHRPSRRLPVLATSPEMRRAAQRRRRVSDLCPSSAAMSRLRCQAARLDEGQFLSLTRLPRRLGANYLLLPQSPGEQQRH